MLRPWLAAIVLVAVTGCASTLTGETPRPEPAAAALAPVAAPVATASAPPLRLPRPIDEPRVALERAETLRRVATELRSSGRVIEARTLEDAAVAIVRESRRAWREWRESEATFAAWSIAEDRRRAVEAADAAQRPPGEVSRSGPSADSYPLRSSSSSSHTPSPPDDREKTVQVPEGRNLRQAARPATTALSVALFDRLNEGRRMDTYVALDPHPPCLEIRAPKVDHPTLAVCLVLSTWAREWPFDPPVPAVPSLAQRINSGKCNVFAGSVCSLLRDAERAEVFRAQGLCGDESGHWWVRLDGRHYDAECPQGAVRARELPLFTRVFARCSRPGVWSSWKDFALAFGAELDAL
jgi:hypothetical protein